MKTFYQYLGRANEKIDFLYLRLDLSQIDLFKMVRGGKLVDDEEVPPVEEVALNDHQATKGVARPRNTLEDQ